MIAYDRKKLGKHLQSARHRSGLSQVKVSKALGYSSPQFVSNIERGVSSAPLKTIAKMLSLYREKPDRALQIIMETQSKMLKEKLMRAR